MKVIARVIALPAALLVSALTAAALNSAPASATTPRCADSNVDNTGAHHCGGYRSHQRHPLEITVSGTAANAKSGTYVVAVTPGYNKMQDWYLQVPAAGGSGDYANEIFEFALNGIRSGLCLSSSVAGNVGSQLRLRTCVPGGSPRQIWSPISADGSGFLGNYVWQNLDDDLVFTANGTASGSKLVLRPIGLGTALAKNWNSRGFQGATP
jgi:hypothetical protein